MFRGADSRDLGDCGDCKGLAGMSQIRPTAIVAAPESVRADDFNVKQKLQICCNAGSAEPDLRSRLRNSILGVQSTGRAGRGDRRCAVALGGASFTSA